MSKKIVSFALPANRSCQVEEVLAGDISGRGPDSWVHAARPDRREPAIMDPMLIDLSVRRNWFELVQLIYVFPYLATWSWVARAAFPRSTRLR
jgi:hypothetical protein